MLISFNEFGNIFNIKLLKGTKNSILYMTEYKLNGKNLKIIPIDLSLKDKYIAYCHELVFGIISFSSFINIETMNIISSDVETNEYKLLGVKSDKLVNALKLLGLPHFLGLFKQSKEEGKIKCVDTNKELVKYVKLNKTELHYMMIKKFKDRK